VCSELTDEFKEEIQLAEFLACGHLGSFVF
jgi:hypothetical protein